ncbi:hypothetical protein AGMMS4957_20140 [Bacteroidia bacterium]|nr:hypothetical protein AGMMS4957_20140 [Bacteroidia bacterium]
MKKIKFIVMALCVTAISWGGCNHNFEETPVGETPVEETPIDDSQGVFPLDNATWTEKVRLANGSEKYISYSLRGDTVFDGLRRSKLYCCPNIEQDYSELIGFIHEEKGKVYFRHQKGLGWSSDYLMLCKNDDTDMLLYDFTLEKDAMYPGCFTIDGDAFLFDTDTVFLGNTKRRRFRFYIDSPIPFPIGFYSYIEGMGSPKSLFGPIETIDFLTDTWKRLISFSQNGEVLWPSPFNSDVQTEKIIVNKAKK